MQSTSVFSKQEIAKFRADTPGTQHVTHFNNAGSSLVAQPTYDAVKQYWEEELKLGGYETHKRNLEQLRDFYQVAAQLINAQANEIAFTESATIAWRKAFNAIPFKTGDIILTSRVEYGSNYIGYLQMQQQKGIIIKVIPSEANGQVDVSKLRKLINNKVKLISITHIPTNGGLVNPVEEIGEIARRNNILYLVDACQSVGQYPVDVEKIGCDFLSATGRKYLRAPRGTGFLYARQSAIQHLNEPDYLDLYSANWRTANHYELHPTAQRFELFECSHANKIGCRTAIQYVLDIGIEKVWQRIQYLATMLREKLTLLPDITVHDLGLVQGGLVTFSVREKRPSHIQELLAAQNINVSISERGSTLIDMDHRQINTLVRASVHYYNTEAEIERLCACL